MTEPPRVRVSTLVAVNPEEAFRVFTEEIDAWWKRSPRFRVSSDPKGALRFEPGEGGNLIETGDDLEGGQYEFGRVLVWKPAERLTFEFRARANALGEESEVDVTFETAGDGTRVTVVQTGWEDLPEDHPARHGMGDDAMFDMLALFWADLLSGARVHANRGMNQRTGSPESRNE
jgi:uncharacterized protein YndB with AHSA1/START domain